MNVRIAIGSLVCKSSKATLKIYYDLSFLSHKDICKTALSHCTKNEGERQVLIRKATIHIII